MGSVGLSQSPKAEDGGIWVPTTRGSWDPTSVQSKGGCITSVGGRGGWTGGQCLGGWGKSGGRKVIASPCPLTWGARWLRGSASQRPQGEGWSLFALPQGGESRPTSPHFTAGRPLPAAPSPACSSCRGLSSWAASRIHQSCPPQPPPHSQVTLLTSLRWKDCDSLTATSMSPTRERQDRSSEHFKTRYKIRAGFACFS